MKILEEHQPIEQFSLLHTNALENAMAFHEQAAHLLPAEITHTINITPILGAHLGPGAVGYAIVSKNAV
jgi:fatty acid-binding protein DegV